MVLALERLIRDLMSRRRVTATAAGVNDLIAEITIVHITARKDN